MSDKHPSHCGITCYDIPWGYFRAKIKSMLIKMFPSLNCSPYCNTKRHFMHLLKAFYSCWHNLFLCFCLTQRFLFKCFVHVLQENIVLFMWYDLLFHGAKDDSVIFVSLCLCVFVARIRDFFFFFFCTSSGWLCQFHRASERGLGAIWSNDVDRFKGKIHWAIPCVFDNKSSEYEHRQLSTKTTNYNKFVSLKFALKL